MAKQGQVRLQNLPKEGKINESERSMIIYFDADKTNESKFRECTNGSKKKNDDEPHLKTTI